MSRIEQLASIGEPLADEPPSVDEPDIPRDAYEAAVEQMVLAVREVAISDPNSEYALLPIQPLENFDIAHCLADARPVGQTTIEINRVTAEQRLVRYHHGQLYGVGLEFAEEHVGPSPDISTNPVLAWGVRRIELDSQGVAPQGLIDPPSRIFAAFRNDIARSNLDGVDRGF